MLSEDIFPLDIKGKCIQDGNSRAFLFQIETFGNRIHIMLQNKGVEAGR